MRSPAASQQYFPLFPRTAPTMSSSPVSPLTLPEISTQDPMYCAERGCDILGPLPKRGFGELTIYKPEEYEADEDLFRTPPPKRSCARVISASDYFLGSGRTFVPGSPAVAAPTSPARDESESESEEARAEPEPLKECVPDWTDESCKVLVGSTIYASKQGFCGLSTLLARALRKETHGRLRARAATERQRRTIEELYAEKRELAEAKLQSGAEKVELKTECDQLKQINLELVSKLATAEAALDQATEEETTEMSRLREAHEKTTQQLKETELKLKCAVTMIDTLKIMCQDRRVMLNERADTIKLLQGCLAARMGLPPVPVLAPSALIAAEAKRRASK